MAVKSNSALKNTISRQYHDLADSTLNLTDGGALSGPIAARGYASTKPSILTKWPAHTSIGATSNQTLTIAQLLTGVIEEDPEGAANWTLPTAALAVAGVDGVQVGDCIDFCLINAATTGADEIVTVVMGSNGTAVGNMSIAAPNITEDQENVGSGLFRLRFTAVTGTETYTCYRLA
tara:strand:+ start:135 stop:665 length:531 start_codon:yes stop_codon:yes gene_type:complete